MDDDYNTALAVGHIFELIREINRFLDLKPSIEAAGTLITQAKESLAMIGGVLNLFDRTPEQWNIDLLRNRNIPLSETQIQQGINERKSARESKDWARADEIRKELEEKGILLEDRQDGTTWKVKIV